MKEVSVRAITGFVETHKDKEDCRSERLVTAPTFNNPLLVRFFNGASQVNGFSCGASAYLKLNETYAFEIKLNCGKGTNTRGEFLALWGLLFFVCFKHITHLQVVGDYKVDIKWAVKKCQLQVASLKGWKHKVIRLKG